jgi:O-antigen/teichoic acid export membrane protein
VTPSVLSRSLRFNAGSVLAARLLVPALNLALVVSIARRLGAAELGRYTLLVTAFLVIERLTSLGLSTLLVREVARHPAAGPSYRRGLVRIGLGGAVAVTLATSLFTLGSGHQELGPAALVMATGLFASAYALANDAVFLALGHSHLGTLVASVENGLRVFLSLVAVLAFGGGILALAVVFALTRALAAALGTRLVFGRLGLPAVAHEPGCTATMLRAAPEFLVIFALPILLFRMDVVALSVLGGDYAVGIYAAAMRLISVCLVVPDSLMTATFAFLSKFAGQDEAAARALVGRAVRWMVLLLVPATIGGLLLGPDLLRLLFGAEFAASGGILRVLVFALLPFALNRVLGDTVVAHGHQRELSRAIVATTFVTLPAYAVLVPAHGGTGAAWGFVFSVYILFALTAVECLVRLRLAPAVGVAAALAPVALAMAVVHLAPEAGRGRAAVEAVAAGLCLAPFASSAARELRRRRATRPAEAS